MERKNFLIEFSNSLIFFTSNGRVLKCDEFRRIVLYTLSMTLYNNN